MLKLIQIDNYTTKQLKRIANNLSKIIEERSFEKSINSSPYQISSEELMFIETPYFYYLDMHGQVKKWNGKGRMPNYLLNKELYRYKVKNT
ncbi:hypothetical protein ACPV5G_16195 [Photobacterium damselae]|uniref:hypothetical protein n=1 Tax=Photobacterium damselae TaxID=38293 RepID=UPI00406945F9